MAAIPDLDRAGLAPTPRSWLDSAATVAARLAEGAAARDRERRFPHAELAELRASGLERLTVPVAAGGLGGSLADAVRVTTELATGDPNVAQMYHVHLTGVALLEHADPGLCEELLARAVAGELCFTNAFSERGGSGFGDFTTTIALDPVAGEAVVGGSKFYSTGSLAGDETVVIGNDPGDGNRVWVAFVPCDTPGVSILDDWAAMGQATTASGSTVFDDVRIPARRLLDPSWQAVPDEPFALFSPLSLSGIHVGIARNAFADAVAYLRARTRPPLLSMSATAQVDPYVLHHVGELRNWLDAAEGLQERAVLAFALACRQRSPGHRAFASVAVSQAKTFTATAALRVCELLFQACGTGATLSEHGLDRHWRNVRTLSVNDAGDHRLRHVGDWYLNGTVPPITGST